MSELWFAIIAGMLTVYVVLDGFDLGAGALHLGLAKRDPERRAVFAAIGPYWDANEVWLIAAGGSLVAAFPRVASSALSGFYLAIFIVVWCLILRAIAIELRNHLAVAIWQEFWDVVFAGASALVPLLLGVALGNVLRGVPLDADGWFRLTLFTTFRPAVPVGILDAYTLFVGLFALVTAMAHGAAFLAWHADGIVAERARSTALRLCIAVAVAWPLVTLATHAVNPDLLAALPGRPAAWMGLALALGGLVTAILAGRGGRAFVAALGTSAFVAGVLMATAACLYPVMLRAIPDPARSLTAPAGGNTPHGLRIALGWWAAGIPFVIAWFVILFRVHRPRPATGR